MKTCGICGKELDHGAVVHRACLEERKAGYGNLNEFQQSVVAKLLEKNARLRAEIVALRARLEK